MNTRLFKDIFNTDQSPTKEFLHELTMAATELPDNIFYALFLHYHHNKEPHQIALITGHSPQLIQTWLKSGVAILQVYYKVGR